MTLKNQSNDMPWAMPVVVGSIAESGMHMSIEANPSQRAAIAALTGLRELSMLTATFDLTHRSKKEIHVTGTVTARVGQSCVVTLEPVDNDISEDVDVVFSSAIEPVAVKPSQVDDEENEVDPPEPIIGDTIDLGKLATEYLVIGIDPYPRKPGVEFAPILTPEPPEDHPFAALAALKADEPGKKPKKPGKK